MNNYQEVKKRLKKEMGFWRWHYYGVIGWIEDRWVVQFMKDLWWWAFDGKAYWKDSVPCERKLCRHCGKKPFQK